MDKLWIFLVLMIMIPIKGMAEDRYANVFNDICSTLKINQNQIQLKVINDGIAYCQNFSDNKAVISFNKNEFDKFPISYFLGVMCHELGHFINRDKMGCDSIAEGRADEFAGYSLRKMNLDVHSSLLFLKIYKGSSTICYPNQFQRESFVIQGWNRLDKELIDKNHFNQLTPRITWSLTNSKKLEINIGARKISFSNWQKNEDVVVIYDSITTSTIQLLDYKFKAKASGLGRLITSQGLYSYFLYPKKILKGNNFQIFYKGKVKKLAECDQNNYRDGYDLIVNCQDSDNGNVEVGFRLVDYFLAPNNYVLPAVYL